MTTPGQKPLDSPIGGLPQDRIAPAKPALGSRAYLSEYGYGAAIGIALPPAGGYGFSETFMGVTAPQTALRYAKEGDHAAGMIVRESTPTGAPKPKLLDQVRQRIRARHYSPRTEKAYVH